MTGWTAWQPIETAPKDGTYILAWRSRGMQVMRWKQVADEGFWDALRVPLKELRESPPTHWLPLPSAPREIDAA